MSTGDCVFVKLVGVALSIPATLVLIPALGAVVAAVRPVIFEASVVGLQHYVSRCSVLKPTG